MTDDALVKIIQKALKDEVRPLQEDLKVVTTQVTNIELLQDANTKQIELIAKHQSVTNQKFETVIEDFSSFKESLVELEDIIKNRIYPSVVHTENTVGAFGDAYKINNDNARKLEKRVVRLEDKAKINLQKNICWLILANQYRINLRFS